MKKGNTTRRAAVYIDGYNLYYGLQEAFGKRYNWLDLQALAAGFMQPGMKLVMVKYFTSIAKKDPAGAGIRQLIYRRALQSHCNKLEIHYGQFLSILKKCKFCGRQHIAQEEKKTDVNIACHILNDAHKNLYDCCYLVSGDSDLVPPIKFIKRYYPNKRTIVAHPPKRKSSELCNIANHQFSIAQSDLRQSQLPPKIITRRGTITRPSQWHPNPTPPSEQSHA